MGVTLCCKKTGRSMDMGYGGFDRLRLKVGELVGEPFASHLAKLSTPKYMFCLDAEERKKLFSEYDAETAKILDEGKAPIKIVDFCLQPDVGGKIRYGACKEILKVIGDYDDKATKYGYAAHPNCATFHDFKAILQDCVDNKCMLIWG